LPLDVGAFVIANIHVNFWGIADVQEATTKTTPSILKAILKFMVSRASQMYFSKKRRKLVQGHGTIHFGEVW
jgi:hypothetical protein